MFIQAISNIRHFVNVNLNGRYKVPDIAIWLFVTRIARNPVGESVLKQYAKACEDEEIARQTFQMMLQQIQPLIELSIVSSEVVADQRMGSSGLSLKEIIDNQLARSAIHGTATEPLLKYLYAARNMYVHNGRILKEGDGVSLDAICQGKCLTYKDLCSLFMAALVAVFYVNNPHRCEWAFLKYPRCVLSMALTHVYWGIRWIWNLLIALSGQILGIGGAIAVVLGGIFVVFAVISCINQCNRSDEQKYEFSEVDPDSLEVWVQEMSPFEQMEYLANRQKSLSAIGDNHRVGDTPVTEADHTTEKLYKLAIDSGMPDVKAWYVKLFPNTSALSRHPVYGLFLNAKGDPRAIMADKSEIKFSDTYMPIYYDGYYPLLTLRPYSYGRDVSDAFITNIGSSLAARPGIEVMLAVGTGFDKDSRSYKSSLEANRKLEEKMKAALVKGGLRSSRIRVIDDDKNTSVSILFRIKP